MTYIIILILVLIILSMKIDKERVERLHEAQVWRLNDQKSKLIDIMDEVAEDMNNTRGMM